MRRTFLLCLLAALLVAPAARADTVTKILRDCEDDGQLQGHYSPAELRKALRHMPTDIDEYSDCRDVLSRAASAGVGSGGGGGSPSGGGGGAVGGGGGGGGSNSSESQLLVTPSTPEDSKAIASAAGKGAPAPVVVRGRPVLPGASGLAADAARNDLPSTLRVVLILLGAATLAALGPFVRRRVLARRRS